MTIAAAAIDVAVSLVTIGLSAIATYVWVTNTYAWKRVADIEKEVADIEKEVADIAAKRAAINAESQRWPAYSPDHHHTTQDPNRHVATVSLAFFSYRRGGWTPQPSTLSLSRDITPSQDGDQ